MEVIRHHHPAVRERAGRLSHSVDSLQSPLRRRFYGKAEAVDDLASLDTDHRAGMVSTADSGIRLSHFWDRESIEAGGPIQEPQHYLKGVFSRIQIRQIRTRRSCFGTLQTLYL